MTTQPHPRMPGGAFTLPSGDPQPTNQLSAVGLVRRVAALLREAAATHRDPFFLVGEVASLGRQARRRAEYRGSADFADAAYAAADACRALLECASHSAPLAAHARVGCGLLAASFDRLWGAS